MNSTYTIYIIKYIKTKINYSAKNFIFSIDGIKEEGVMKIRGCISISRKTKGGGVQPEVNRVE